MTKNILIVGLILIILAGGGYVAYTAMQPKTGTDIVVVIPTPTPTDSQPTEKMKVKYALLGFASRNMDLAGCDLVFMKEVEVPKTSAPLNAALNALFARKESWPYSETVPGNFITSQTNLVYKGVILENGIAKVYLTGSQSFAGVCDDPRLKNQIDNTALQFPTVKSVEIYLNSAILTPPKYN